MVVGFIRGGRLGSGDFAAFLRIVAGFLRGGGGGDFTAFLFRVAGLWRDRNRRIAGLGIFLCWVAGLLGDRRGRGWTAFSLGLCSQASG